MTGLIIELSLLLIALTSQSLAQALPSLPEPAKDLFVGTWKANADKSRPVHNDYDVQHKSYVVDVVTYSRDGDNLVASYRKRSHEYHDRMRCDGKLHQTELSEASCWISCKYLAPNHIEGSYFFSDGTNNINYWTRELSSDGQEMTLWDYKDKARKKLKGFVVRERVK
jgi:hypothetical protein